MQNKGKGAGAQKRRRVTVRDVAREAGISAGAASVALNGGASGIGVSPATRERVRKIAARLGYRVNAAARATITGRYGAAGMIFGQDYFDSYVNPSRLDALLRAFCGAGMNLSLTRLDDEFLSDETAVAGTLSRLYADGLLIAYNAKIPATFPVLLEKLQIPSVWMNLDRPSNAVYPDDRAGAEALTREVISQGKEDLVFVADPGLSHYSFAARRQGFEAAARAAGLSAHVVTARIGGDGAVAVEPFLELFSDPARRPAVVVYATSPIMDAVITAARAQDRLHGRDWTLAAFAEKPFEVDGVPATVAMIDEPLFAANVLEVFRRVTEDPATPVPSVAVPYGILPAAN